MRHKTNLIKLHTLNVLDLTWFVIFSAKQWSRYFILTCVKLPLKVVFNTLLYFFCRIKKLLTEKKAKSERENNLIYHQKQPEVRRNSQNIWYMGYCVRVRPRWVEWTKSFFLLIHLSVWPNTLAKHCLWHTVHRFLEGSMGNPKTARNPYPTRHCSFTFSVLAGTTKEQAGRDDSAGGVTQKNDFIPKVVWERRLAFESPVPARAANSKAIRWKGVRRGARGYAARACAPTWACAHAIPKVFN